MVGLPCLSGMVAAICEVDRTVMRLGCQTLSCLENENVSPAFPDFSFDLSTGASSPMTCDVSGCLHRGSTYSGSLAKGGQRDPSTLPAAPVGMTGRQLRTTLRLDPSPGR